MHPRTLELLQHLDRQRVILRAAFDAVPPAMREQPPAPGRWSAAGIIEHLAIVESRVSAGLFRKISEAEANGLGRDLATDPILPTLNLSRVANRTERVNAPETSHPTGLTADVAWTALENAGAGIRQMLRAADGLALGAVTMPHPLFGEMTAHEWFAMLGTHEARHAEQIREISAGEPRAL